MIIDPIGDMLTRIRNIIKNKGTIVLVPHSKIKTKILKILKDEGYINNYFITTDEKKHKVIKIMLKYVYNQQAINGLKRISKPGLRVYVKRENLPRVLSNFGIAIMSTSQGIMTNKNAKINKLGGEVIAFVW